MSIRRIPLTGLLGASTAMALALATQAHAQDCGSGIPCGDNSDVVVSIPAGPNTERDTIPDLRDDGFDIFVDGVPVDENGDVVARPGPSGSEERRQDRALAAADVAVQFDGLDVQPRLTLGLDRSDQAVAPGARVVLRNEMNYPAFVARGELRVIDRSARGGPRVVSTIPLAPNGTVTVPAPEEGADYAYVYRVYDARGRYDETRPAALDQLGERGLNDLAEAGQDATATSRIPVFGGAVTVSGRGVGQGRQVRTLGETIRADGEGDFVLQRILPTGAHEVTVDVAGRPALNREIDIPASDLFYIGIVDVTIGKSIENELEAATDPSYDDTFERGRIAFYLKGKVKGDVLITAAADTGEEDLGDIFSNLDEKNPRSLIDRIDPDEYYPVYGDDSTAQTDAPTAGKLYVKIERDDSHVLWGTFQSEIGETEYLRNERTLYGAQGVWRSPAQTSRGEPVVEAQVYAAQPESLPQRDVFLGTGGSSYFLKFQDISRGSETVQVEIQDEDTGRIISRQSLIYGVDYDINYIQGLVILKKPLSAYAGSSGVVVENPLGSNQAYLVVTYDHTPTISDIDSYSYGGRVQAWATDRLRFGATVQEEDLGTTEQTAYGADILFRHSEKTYVEVEYARTDGTGSDQDLSVDGGLSLNTVPGVAGDGRAFRFRGQADLRDLGAGVDGVVGGYFEDREAGFSTLSYRSTNDETLWGVYGEVDTSDQVTFRFEYDSLEDSAGRVLREADVILTYRHTEALTWDFGIQHRDEVRPGVPADTGSRTDAAVRATYAPGDAYSIYGYLQGTLERSGGLSRNNRVGVGGKVALNDQWRLEGEVSEGTLGFGARALVTYEQDGDNEAYFGYTLDPDRDFGGIALTGQDEGSFVLGGRRRVNERVTYFGENTYDIFGAHRALTSGYGAEYGVTENLTFDAGLEVGRVRDPILNSEFDRTALSFGATYERDDLRWRGRIEWRRDEGLMTGTNRDADFIAGEFALRYNFSDSARMLFAVEGAYSDNATASIPDAEYLETTLGYAYRPVTNDRLNVLAKYTYLYDMTERVGASPASGSNFLTTPRQRAHIVSLDASYDLNERWTLGGKIGGRWSEQDTGAGFESNDATLGVLNLRYHSVHKWDALFEVRQLAAEDLGTDHGVLGAVYRHVGNNFKVGVGYNAGRFSDDLRDVTYNDRGVFINLVGKF